MEPNMDRAETLFHAIGKALNDAESAQFFGKKCFKINGKAFVAYFEECMVFKLNADEKERALALFGAKLFDPSGKNRPMKEWIQVPFEHKDIWPQFAEVAKSYVEHISK